MASPPIRAGDGSKTNFRKKSTSKCMRAPSTSREHGRASADARPSSRSYLRKTTASVMPHLSVIDLRLPSAYIASMAAWTAVLSAVSSLRTAMPIGAGSIGVPPISNLPLFSGLEL